MTRIVQEKFQVTAPANKNDDSSSGWASDSSARDRHGLTTRETESGRYQGRAGYNALPPGMNIEDQECRDIPAEAMSSGQLGSGEQATVDVTRESLREGFARKRMRPTDDMYTREHNDAFYDEVTVEGVTGFVERNNMLDRL